MRARIVFATLFANAVENASMRRTLVPFRTDAAAAADVAVPVIAIVGASGSGKSTLLRETVGCCPASLHVDALELAPVWAPAPASRAPLLALDHAEGLFSKQGVDAAALVSWARERASTLLVACQSLQDAQELLRHSGLDLLVIKLFGQGWATVTRHRATRSVAIDKVRAHLREHAHRIYAAHAVPPGGAPYQCANCAARSDHRRLAEPAR